MSEKDKTILLVFSAIVLLALTAYLVIAGLTFLKVDVPSVADIKKKVDSAGNINLSFEKSQSTYDNKIAEKIKATNEFEEQKTKYSAISEETIALIKDVTKDQKYMIEYLWISLGDYAEDNNLKLVVMEPGQSAAFNITQGDVKVSNSKPATTTTTATSATTTDEKSSAGNIIINPTTDEKTVKILVIGTYQDIADFVFDVENDKALKFKLDNISMQYAGKNAVLAQFDVLGMSVLLK